MSTNIIKCKLHISEECSNIKKIEEKEKWYGFTCLKCRELNRNINKNKYYKDNKELIRTDRIIKYQKNPEKVKQRSKDYYEKNKNKILTRQKEYRKGKKQDDDLC